jgi:hypothetical protein
MGRLDSTCTGSPPQQARVAHDGAGAPRAFAQRRSLDFFREERFGVGDHGGFQRDGPGVKLLAVGGTS